MSRLFVVIGFILILSGCDWLLVEVTYEVTGTAGLVDITIQNEDDSISQFDDVSTPWTYSFYPSGTFVYVSAQNQRDSGSVTARIYLDGNLEKESTSIGAYVIATASMSSYENTY